MSWKDHNRLAQRAIIQSVDKSILPSGYGGGTRNGYTASNYYAQPSKFMAVLQANSMWNEIAPAPIMMRDLYRIILWAIPELAAALDMHARVIGCPTVETKDKVFAKDFEDWAKEMPWKGEKKFPYDGMKGLASYLYGLQIATLGGGQSWATLMDSSGNQIARPSQNIDFVRLHDSSRFNYMEIMVDEFQLTYEHGGQIFLDIQESFSRDTVRFITSTKFPEWGVPILYGCERAATDTMVAQEMWMANNKRIANPSSVAIFGSEPPAGLATDDAGLLKEISEQWDARMAQITSDFAANFARSANNGRSFQALEATTGKITVAEHIFGKDIKPVGTYSENVDPHLRAALIGMYAVPDLFGIQTMSGGGIGSDQHTQMSQRSESFGISCRPPQEAHVRWLMGNFFLKTSKRIPDFTFKWVGLDISNKKAEAEVKQIAATAMNLNVTTAQLIADGVGPLAANQWLLENNMGYKFPASYKPEPDPMPKI